MATTGNIFAGTGENNAGIGATAWTSPTSVTADDTVDATCNAAASSQYLVARNFDFSAVPNDAIITGITVRIDASEHSTSTESLNAQLQDASGALFGSSQAQTINGTTKAVYTYGSTTDVWGATLTPAVVKDADFGVRLWFTTSHDVRIDYVTMAVEYQLAPTPKTRTAAPQQTVVRERVGFAVAFLAAAAHIPAPPGTDTIGPAQYSLGTHQAALGQHQPKPWIRTTPSALIPAPAVADSPANRFVFAGPQVDQHRAPRISGAQIADTALTRIVVTIPQTADNKPAQVWHALIPAPAVADIPQGRLVAASPQRSSDPQPAFAKVLIPGPVVGTDVIGGASYTAGTHRPIHIAPALFKAIIPAPVVGTDVQYTRLIVAAPQRVPSGDARVYGYTPPTLEERLFTRYYEADQQVVRQPQPYIARFQITVPAGTDVSLTRLIVTAPQQVPSGTARFTRALIDALPIDTPQPKLLQAGQWPWQQTQPVLFRAQIEPLAINTPTARTLLTSPQQLAQGSARLFGRLLVESVVVPDAPVTRFVSSTAQTDRRVDGLVWHAQIPEVSFNAHFVAVSPQASIGGQGWVKSPATAYQVLGTDTAVGVFRFSDQRFVPIQYGIASRLELSWIVSGELLPNGRVIELSGRSTEINLHGGRGLIKVFR